jgi:hypothetical protein
VINICISFLPLKKLYMVCVIYIVIYRIASSSFLFFNLQEIIGFYKHIYTPSDLFDLD